MVLAFNTPTDRMMARAAIAIISIGLLVGMYELGQPLYWRFYATVVHPFEDHEPLRAGETDQPAGNDLLDVAAKVMAQNANKERKPFDPEDYKLTTQLIQKASQGGYIMVTWANEHYLDFALSWVANLQTAGVTGYLVGAMDDDMLRQLVDRNIHTWRMNTGITKNDLGWGSANFHKMGRSKIQLIQGVLAVTDLTVVISDIDTAWVRNPIPFFDRFPEADILTSTDQLGPTVMSEDLERFPDAGSSFNIGIMMFRPKSRQFVDQWVKVLEKPDYWDQTAFNDLVRAGHDKSNDKGLFKGYNHSLTVGVLPASQFCSGHTFFVQRKYEEFHLQPYVAHATFQYSGTPGKKHRFREAMLFEDPPEYYDHPKGFITFKVTFPDGMLEAATGVKGEMTADKMVRHFSLVHHQLSFIRAGLALATLTGRAIVLPPIMCELDKYWAPLFDGNIPGSHFKKPFICPMDHVLDLEAGWQPKKDVNVFGPHIEWREYSFFQNPRLSKKVNSSRLSVDICAPEEAGCSDGSAPAVVTNDKIRLAPGQDSTKLLKSLESTSGYKVLDVTNILQMWPAFKEDAGWFTDAEQHKRFVMRLKHMTSVDCCLNKNPGWVWYDFLWDVPHRDRHNRKYDAWQVRMGDTNQLYEEGKATARRMLMLSDIDGSESPVVNSMRENAML